MDQIKDIMKNLLGNGEQPARALSGTGNNALQTMVAAVKDSLSHGRMASQHLAQLMTHPVVVSFFIGIALGGMITQLVKDQWENENQAVEQDLME
jgi:hypothetical protein